MTSKAINSNSKFNIYASFNLSADDVNTLSLLYAPLIGSDAFLLYMGLTSLLDKTSLACKDLKHQDLFDAFSFTLQSFNKARYKLEGAGLLVTYVSNDGDYTYMINPPYSAKNFILDSPLVFYLKSKVSEESFKRIYEKFVIDSVSKNELTNITKSFDEVYQSDVYTDETIKKFGYIIGKNAKNLKINENTFDFDKFTKLIDKSYLPLGITNEFKEKIIQFAYVYQFNEDEMSYIFSESLDRKNEFSMNLMKKKIGVYFQARRNINSPKLKEKSDNDNSNIDQIEYLENISPTELLDVMSPDYPSSYLATINEIYSRIDLPRGVLNCMICKVLRDKNGELPGIKYFEKVAESWISDNVLTTNDAIKYVTTLKESKNSYSTKSSVKNNPIDQDNGGFRSL